MKENWERMKNTSKLNEEEIEQTLKLWKPDLENYQIKELSGGLSHTNYKATFSDHPPLVLRVSEDELNLKMEKNLHDRLDNNNKVPHFFEIIPIKSYKVGVLEWKQGQSVKDLLYRGVSSVQRKLGFSAGVELAKLRSYSFNKSGFLNQSLEVDEVFNMTPESFMKTIDHFLEEYIPKWIEAEFIRKIREFAKERSWLIELDGFSSSLVHGDFNGLNLLGNKGEITAVLDWEFAMSGSLYWDIGNFIRYQSIPNFQHCEKGLVEGLKSKGITLPDEWKQIAQLYDLVALCSMLNTKENGPNRIADLKSLIDQTLS
ncbi:phosphotransferase family protein [Halobacillus mangrovi]|uniref:Aminoglycoside phosphotransferase domain-containing protein n=1 Tax=Halobacillus mangrovi TaxID=402384 RepID=A0A1W5ZYC1_9BACI|nr:aminoglycoside phosphotransferase family protein [Halobacillus mangrovi]ARI78345.1 hypothetical protein HM131_16540 [Halobacillus mangrovi]